MKFSPKKRGHADFNFSAFKNLSIKISLPRWRSARPFNSQYPVTPRKSYLNNFPYFFIFFLVLPKMRFKNIIFILLLNLPVG